MKHSSFCCCWCLLHFMSRISRARLKHTHVKAHTKNNTLPNAEDEQIWQISGTYKRKIAKRASQRERMRERENNFVLFDAFRSSLWFTSAMRQAATFEIGIDGTQFFFSFLFVIIVSLRHSNDTHTQMQKQMIYSRAERYRIEQNDWHPVHTQTLTQLQNSILQSCTFSYTSIRNGLDNCSQQPERSREIQQQNTMNEEYLVKGFVWLLERALAAVTHLTKYMQIIRKRSATIVTEIFSREKCVGRAVAFYFRCARITSFCEE